MKSRISSFNGAAFRKNLTRFAPAWGLYTLCLLLGLVLLCESGVDYHLSDNLGTCILIMAPINLCYALVCAQLLFGDLYNSRLCNALHAMPIRREGWFAVNVASGLFFSMVPTAIMTAAALGLSYFSIVTDAWQIPLWWWLGTNLEFVCFFGIVVFSALCAGNRLAMAVVYGILNCFAMLVFWVVDSIYTPMLYGIEVVQEQFLPFTPVAQMANSTFVECQRIYAEGEVKQRVIGACFTVSSDWWYLAAYAAVGVALMGVALLLYRRRKLECAGDFMAVRALEPVFQVLITVTTAVVAQLGWYEFTYDDTFVFLFVGLIVGYFAARMLIERTPRVFRLKNWFGLVMLAVAIAASLVATALDPLGIVTWVPKAEDVKSVELVVGSYLHTNPQFYVHLEDPADIEDMIFVHEQSLADRNRQDGRISLETASVLEPTVTASEQTVTTEMPYQWSDNIILRYTMKNGAVRTRYLDIWTQDKAGDVVKRYFSSVQGVFGVEDLTDIQENVYSIYLDGLLIPAQMWSQADIPSLLQAIEDDAAAGDLMQRLNFHDRHGVIGETEYDKINTLWMKFQMGETNYSLLIFADSGNVLNWLNERGMVDYYISEAYGIK